MQLMFLFFMVLCGALTLETLTSVPRQNRYAVFDTAATQKSNHTHTHNYNGTLRTSKDTHTNKNENSIKFTSGPVCVAAFLMELSPRTKQ